MQHLLQLQLCKFPAGLEMCSARGIPGWFSCIAVQFLQCRMNLAQQSANVLTTTFNEAPRLGTQNSKSFSRTLNNPLIGEKDLFLFWKGKTDELRFFLFINTFLYESYKRYVLYLINNNALSVDSGAISKKSFLQKMTLSKSVKPYTREKILFPHKKI